MGSERVGTPYTETQKKLQVFKTKRKGGTRDITSPDHFEAKGYSHQGYSHQGYSHQGYSHQGYSHQGYSHQGYSHQGATDIKVYRNL